jgi:hypothetical protein
VSYREIYIPASRAQVVVSFWAGFAMGVAFLALFVELFVGGW